MHELGLLHQVIKTIDGVMVEQGLTEVDSITLTVGEMTDVVPRFLEEAWKVAKDGTSYPNAILKVEISPAIAKCQACNFQASVKEFDFACPKCNSSSLKVISGREFEIKEILAKQYKKGIMVKTIIPFPISKIL